MQASTDSQTMLKNNAPLLDIRNLRVHFHTDTGIVKAVEGLNLTLNAGESLGLVGETGAGKTTTALAVMQLIPSPPGKIVSGEIWLEGENLLTLTEEEKRHVRGQKAAMIFQDPMTALNPVMKVQDQIAEMIRLHQPVSHAEALEKAIEMLKIVGIQPERGSDYPHQFSGGMKQRVVIAIALACNPKLLIADEPTTALDVTIQAQMLELIRELQQHFKTATILITHDLGVVAEICDSVAIMYAGTFVEKGTVRELFNSPRHPYTLGLFHSIPDMTKNARRLHTIPGLPPDPTILPPGCCFAPRCSVCGQECLEKAPPMTDFSPGHFVACYRDSQSLAAMAAAQRADTCHGGGGGFAGSESVPDMKKDGLIETRGLKKYFSTPRGDLHAVDDLNFTIACGETLGLVGESGCGKSTLGHVLIQLHHATSGSIFFNGEDILAYDKKTLRAFRKRAQMVFQDPYSSLNPRMSVEQLISEPLRIHNVYPNTQELRARVHSLMDLAGLAKRLSTSYPHELDGGRRQRIGVARALALNPEFIVLDEPVSSLDVCIQAQILNLLMDLKEEFKYTYLFITHDLSVVRHISNRIAVMYLGKIIELADRLEIFDNPRHPYTQALLSAIPVPRLDVPHTGRIILEGDVPSPVNPPAGCRFYGRCPSRRDDCQEAHPELEEISPKHFLACYHSGLPRPAIRL